ncbi:phospholipid/glycerol acyltransferase [Chondrocystis sp. NIES-4102]|nr:phospholipid/glycerol acyltransferase [Chondrocystis sp. NIES-4102]
MLSFTPNLIAQSLISGLNLDFTVCHSDRIPQDLPTIVISNHRSFLDAPILIKAIPYSLRIACHHYMGQTPMVREIVDSLGCIPLAEAKQRQKHFFQTASSLLTARQWIGLFPEGTRPMIEPTAPHEIGEFQRGFAHLALQMPVAELAVLPIAIASKSETIYPSIPIRWLAQFDQNEPFFKRQGLHPMLIYHDVQVLIGRPYLINTAKRQDYKGKHAKSLATDLTQYCQTEISNLLQEAIYY